ncbi:MAG: hypothetical protein F9K32_03205 [Desulfobulbaceae bacterium]|nr:MAG: hypothetical protein F9K32_03205 [Desulfobulbaceae bacterium]
MLLLDAGNLLFKPESTATVQERITASTIAEIYGQLPYGAVAVGPYDLPAGIDFLRETTGAKGFPWLSANVVDDDGLPVFEPFRKISKNGLTIGVIGLTGPGSVLPGRIQIVDWNLALPPLLQTLSPSCDLIIVLSSLAEEENRRLMEAHPAVDILISADRRLGNVHPKIVRNTLTAQVVSQGKYLGKLDIDWQKDRPWSRDFSQESASLQEQLALINRRIQRTEIQQQKNGTQERIRLLREQREQVVARLAAINSQQDLLAQDPESLNTFSNSFIALSRNQPESRDANEALAAMQQEIARSYVDGQHRDDSSSSCGQSKQKWQNY